MTKPSPSDKNKNLFRKDTPLYVTAIILVVSCVLVFYLFPHPQPEKIVIQAAPAPACVPDIKFVLSKENKLAQRIYLADLNMESPSIHTLKENINNWVSQNKSLYHAQDISVYYRNLNNGAWFDINGKDTYNPASLLKVSFLIAILKQAESDPGLLEKKIYFDAHFDRTFTQNIVSFALEEKKSYTIRELLYDMVVYSDNDALILISSNLNTDVFNKLYADLQMKPPVPDVAMGDQYSMSVADCCKFFRVLYSSTYLSEENSQFALDLLTKSTYKDGLLKNMNPTFPIAHKFGERIQGKVQQLHEVGIFYTGGQPYLLGVMSSGSDLVQLSSLLGQISGMVYNESTKIN